MNNLTQKTTSQKAQNILGDILFDAENGGTLDETVKGLMIIFDAISEADAPQDLIEDLQFQLYQYTTESKYDFLAYVETVKTQLNK